MSSERQKDPNLESVIADVSAWNDSTRLRDLETYMFEGDITRDIRPVRLTFVLAHGQGVGKTTTSPATLGELRADFKGNYAFEDPGDAHSQHNVVVRWHDAKSGKEVAQRVPTEFVHVRSRVR